MTDGANLHGLVLGDSPATGAASAATTGPAARARANGTAAAARRSSPRLSQSGHQQPSAGTAPAAGAPHPSPPPAPTPAPAPAEPQAPPPEPAVPLPAPETNAASQNTEAALAAALAELAEFKARNAALEEIVSPASTAATSLFSASPSKSARKALPDIVPGFKANPLGTVGE